MQIELNRLLSNVAVLAHKTQNYHWYVKGENFYETHAKLEDFYKEEYDLIDEIAELMLMNDYLPLATMADYLKVAEIKEVAPDYITRKEAYESLLKDHEILLNEAIQIKKEAEENNLYLISAKMDDYIESFSKHIWMLKQALKA